MTDAEWVLLDWLAESWGHPFDGVLLLAWRTLADKPDAHSYAVDVRKALRFATAMARMGRTPDLPGALVAEAGLIAPIDGRPTTGAPEWGKCYIATFQCADEHRARSLCPDERELVAYTQRGRLLHFRWREMWLVDRPWVTAWP